MRPIVLLLSVIVFTGCYNDSSEELYPQPNNNAAGTTCDTLNVTYMSTIQPIFNSNCATSGCHDAVTKSGTYDLTGFAGAKAAVNSGRLLGAIKHLPSFSPMPQGKPKLDDCQIAQIETWVEGGALNN